jgi:hypothetical protein
MRERLGFSSPGSKMLADLAATGIKNFMTAQQVILDIMAQQNTILADGLKPGLSGTPAEGLAEVVHQGLDNFISAQKEFLDIYEAQAEGAVNDFGEGKHFDTGRLSELARKEMRNFLESQKKFLDIVETQLITKKKSAAEHVENGSRRVDVFEMAKKSVDAFIGAQQRLLDLASDQIENEVKFARDVLSLEKGPTTTMADVVKKSVDSFVAAQKALVDLASKPRKPAEPGEDRGSAAAA